MSGKDDGRVNPFADIGELEFKPKIKPKQKPSKDVVDKVSEETGFVSRQAKPEKKRRRYRTGRNVQLNVKVTQYAYDLLHELADEDENKPEVLGDTLEQALVALQEKRAKLKKTTR